eukprot:5294093-Amphidinium_carterae.1
MFSGSKTVKRCKDTAQTCLCVDLHEACSSSHERSSYKHTGSNKQHAVRARGSGCSQKVPSILFRTQETCKVAKQCNIRTPRTRNYPGNGCRGDCIEFLSTAHSFDALTVPKPSWNQPELLSQPLQL